MSRINAAWRIKHRADAKRALQWSHRGILEAFKHHRRINRRGVG